MIKNPFSDMTLPQERLLGIYRGVVEDNSDPLQAGRCRVRVFGIHTPTKIKTRIEGIPTNELPWSEPAIPIMEGGISNYGIFSVPRQGSHVMVFFESGNILAPRYFAAMPAIPTVAADTTKGFNDPAGIYPETAKIGQPDWNKGAGTYPENFVIAVHGGHYVELDSTTGAKRIHIFHNTGTYILIDNDGNIFINGVKNETITIAEDRLKTVGGNQTANVTGTDNETVGGNQTIQTADQTITTSNRTITVNGNYSITVTGTANITVTGPCNITGNPVNIN